VFATVGQTIVFLCRGIDLSVGEMMDISNGLAAVKMQDGGIGSMAGWSAIILLIGAVGGLLNGLLVAVARLQPIVVTLATLSIYHAPTTSSQLTRCAVANAPGLWLATRWRWSERGYGSERRGRSNLRDAFPLLAILVVLFAIFLVVRR
jgi:ribose/xylose/arabinose/galactoside ABC-type transport system permease subunit